MPKVAFFSNHFATRNGHGIARYAHHLFNAFQQLENPPDVIPVAAWSNRDKRDLSILKAETGLRLLPTGRRLTPLLWTFVGFPSIEDLLREQIDIVHAVYLGYCIATSRPYLVTVHDIGPLTHPEFFTDTPPWIMQKSLEQAIKNAVALICVSRTTADSLKEYVQERYGVDLSARVHVVHEGVSEDFFQSPDLSVLDDTKNLDLLGQPFILGVGKVSPRKNFGVIIRAFKKLKGSIPHHLVTVGGDGWDFQSVKRLVTDLELTDRVHLLGYVSDEKLRALYKRATLFVYPSLFEGFGLTILEAMASGCPVVASNISSLPEVAGDAALLVDPRSVDEMATAIKTICLNGSYADELRHKGQIRAKTFSWKNCARDVARIYESVMP